MNNNEQLLTEKIADAIWQIWRCWRLTSHPVKQGKITPEQYWVLHILHRFGPQRIKDIAVRMGTGSSSVTITVKRLERILLTTHYMEEADTVCNRIGILNRGEMVVTGTPAELKAMTGNPGASMDDVFTYFTGNFLDAGGDFRGIRQVRHISRRLG
ncbi:MarR family transcriptional regulator [Desulfofundulus luciae]|nr:MarR family transcriptional regulator [Desulfofundulus luciae]